MCYWINRIGAGWNFLMMYYSFKLLTQIFKAWMELFGIIKWLHIWRKTAIENLHRLILLMQINSISMSSQFNSIAVLYISTTPQVYLGKILKTKWKQIFSHNAQDWHLGSLTQWLFLSQPCSLLLNHTTVVLVKIQVLNSTNTFLKPLLLSAKLVKTQKNMFVGP